MQQRSYVASFVGGRPEWLLRSIVSVLVVNDSLFRIFPHAESIIIHDCQRLRWGIRSGGVGVCFASGGGVVGKWFGNSGKAVGMLRNEK